MGAGNSTIQSTTMKVLQENKTTQVCESDQQVNQAMVNSF